MKRVVIAYETSMALVAAAAVAAISSNLFILYRASADDRKTNIKNTLIELING